MRRKCLKKINIALLFTVAFVLFACLFSVPTYASSKNNEDFSQFLNINKNGTYTEELYIQPIHMTDTYNIAVEYISKYGENFPVDESMRYVSQTNYGFKVNGVFYTEPYTITESGVYRIQTYMYNVSNNIKTISTNTFEDFKVTVDLEKKLSIETKVFYYEHYNYLSDLQNKIASSFNWDVTLTNTCKKLIETLYNDYVTYSKSSIDYADKVNKSVSITINESSVIFPVEFKSVKGSDIEELNWSTAISNIDDILIDTVKYASYRGKNIKEISEINNEISNLKLDIPEGHNVTFTNVECDVTVRSINTATLSSPYYIKYSALDNGSSSYEFERAVYFYNSNLVNDKKGPTIEFNNEVTIAQNNYDFNFVNLISKLYDIVEISGQDLKCYSNTNVSKITVDSSLVDFSKPGSYTVIFTVTDYLGNSSKLSHSVSVVDGKAPIILTKYNLLYLSKDNLDFSDQILIIDNYSVDQSTVSYKLVEENSFGGYIFVSADDTDGNHSERTIRFLYETEMTSFEKYVVLPIYKVKEFFKNLV